MQFVRRALPALAVAFVLAAPSAGLAACAGDCGTDLATVPKTVEKYVKARWKSVLKCGKKANPACPTPCPRPDGTLEPYLLSPSCIALIACNLDALAETAYDATWDDAGVCASAPATACGNVRAATAGKLVLGMWLALLLNRHFRGKRLVRASMLLPFIIPTVLSTFAWKWMFDPTFSVLNWTLYRTGLIETRIGWLTDPTLALLSVTIVNVWRGMPFYAITLLAGLQTVSPELHEAAAIDGANAWQRFWRITWPLLLPVTMVVTLFSVIQTFADFQLVYVLTGGGPANSTHLFATYAYQIGIITGLLGEGAAASLAMFPILFLIVVIQLWYIRRVEGS